MIATKQASPAEILDAITDGLMVLDAEWRITFVNGAAVEMSGFQRDDLIGKNYWELFPAAVGTTLHGEFLRVAASRERAEFDYYYEPLKRWFHVRAYPSAERGLAALYQDITARKRVEEGRAELLRIEREEREEAEILNRVSLALSAELDLQKLIQITTDAATEVIGAEFGAFFCNLGESSNGSDVLYAVSGLNREQFERLALPADGALFHSSSAASEIIRTGDILSDPRYRKSPSDDGVPAWHGSVRSLLTLPVIGRSGYLLGHLIFGHRESSVFNERAERMAAGLAAHAAIAMDNARLFASLEQEVARRKEAEALHRRSEWRFREMIEALPAAVYTTDVEGRITHFNTAAITLTGRVPELDKDSWSIVWKLYSEDGEFIPHDQSPMAEAVRGGKVSRGKEYQAERPDGSRFWFIPYPTPLRDTDGQIVGGIDMLVDITERKSAERASLLLGAIVDSSDDAIISKNLNSIITSWNKGAERIFGYTAEEAVGRSILMLIPPDRHGEELDILDRLRRGERVDHFETIRIRKDGTELNISLTISPVKDAKGRIIGASKIARDITDRKRAEAALRESEMRFRQLADSMPQMVWTARPDGYIDYFNERWYDFTGFSRDVFGDKAWEPIVHPDDLNRSREEWHSSVRTGKPYSIEYRFWNRHDKKWCWFMGRALPVRNEMGDIVKWFGSCIDIDAQKRVENELRRANEDLEQFAYSASHDLQEPLRTVKIYSELLTMRYRHKLDGHALEFCDYVRGGATRMEMLVRDLLAYTQVSKVEEPLDVTDANSAVRDSLANLASSIHESEAVITSDTLPEVRVHLRHLIQLFQNLIGNAIKYRDPDRPPVIHIAATQERETCLFSVKDNGIGIDPEYKEQIFGLFKRLHTGDKYSGTGIGLAICQRIVERYHGRIWVESQPGEGSTFFFTLPR